eukprot:2405443-Rhodomonas_salina.1
MTFASCRSGRSVPVWALGRSFHQVLRASIMWLPRACCDAMQCDAMRCDAMQCDAMQCDAMRCDDVMRCGVSRGPRA